MVQSRGERDQVIEHFSPSNLLNFIAADPGTDQTGENYVDQCKIDCTEKNPVLKARFHVTKILRNFSPFNLDLWSTVDEECKCLD